jgi:tetratricopeptide (TPR) repeat protein
VTTATLPQPATDELPFDERFEALLEQGRVHLDAERYDDALRCYERAEEAARLQGERWAQDRAFVSRWAVLIATERGLAPEPFQRLREILMSGDDPVNCRLAAYNIARAYEFAKEHRKGLFYARIALDRSLILEASDWIASSHNQIGNFLLAESHFEQGLEEYQRALALLPVDQMSVRRAAIFDNLGYALVVVGRVKEGVELLYRSLREFRSMGSRRETILPHLSLCYALLELGRFRHALKHGAVALALAEEAEEPDSIKHALFLLGEAAQQAGDPAEARSIFVRLQERYFPGASYLPDVLLTVDVRKLINLKA